MSRRFVLLASVLLMVAVIGLMTIALYIIADWNREQQSQECCEEFWATVGAGQAAVKKAISATETAKAWTVTPSPIPTTTATLSR